MNRTDEEVEAEVSRQERQAAEAAEIETHIQEYNSDSRSACKEWVWNGGRLGDEYYWAHICGQKYYQLDSPVKCYLGCEEEE
ncbi:hypothetical protein CMI47_16060 [Candidatus Pacearchaeota archaeon]|nr:hypothetical protein [Candidatus Pacearchaeota archaeon]|tara:strand:- start:1728 stop:1973 length:246 start_codon:yes stop_codon:yes gene_type:complete